MSAGDIVSEPTMIIHARTRHLPEHLPEDSDKYAFAYKITITNPNAFPVTLTHRCWLITDANGKTSEVKGEGVVGEQPTILPGDTFQYTSGAVVDTPVASMQGFYELETEAGQRFKAPIDIFRLAVPNIIN